MANDMREAIIPKSDQLNADDLIAGEMTITITGVTVKGGQEQPVSISFAGDNGKPYKACKSMCRVMVAAWGPDSSKYVGRSMTLYRDPAVKWGGMAVGGIRISHMSDIDGSQTMALTMTRGSKKAYTVKPLTVAKNAAPQPTPVPADSIVGGEAAGAAPVINAAQHRRLEARINEVKASRDDMKAYVKKTWGVEHLNELTQDQYDVIDAMLDKKAAKLAPKSDGGIIDMEDSQL
jgi:hypothetical protein